MYGVILVHEVMHSLKISRNRGMMMKLDIAKAYDKLNREFMERMLGAYSFWEIRDGSRVKF